MPAGVVLGLHSHGRAAHGIVHSEYVNRLIVFPVAFANMSCPPGTIRLVKSGHDLAMLAVHDAIILWEILVFIDFYDRISFVILQATFGKYFGLLRSVLK